MEKRFKLITYIIGSIIMIIMSVLTSIVYFLKILQPIKMGIKKIEKELNEINNR